MKEKKRVFVARKLQAPKPEQKIRQPADPKATHSEVRAATSSCVNHLCGCTN